MKATTCIPCGRLIPEHEAKHLIANEHADIPISHFICCSNCAKPQEKTLGEKCNETFNDMRKQYPAMTQGDMQSVATFIKMLCDAMEEK